jgi:hypothetical protein
LPIKVPSDPPTMTVATLIRVPVNGNMMPQEIDA